MQSSLDQKKLYKTYPREQHGARVGDCGDRGTEDGESDEADSEEMGSSESFHCDQENVNTNKKVSIKALWPL